MRQQNFEYIPKGEFYSDRMKGDTKKNSSENFMFNIIRNSNKHQQQQQNFIYVTREKNTYSLRNNILSIHGSAYVVLLCV